MDRTTIFKHLFSLLATTLNLTFAPLQAQWIPVSPAAIENVNVGELNGSRLIAGTASGISRSSDFGLSWESVANTPPRNIWIVAEGNRAWGLFYSIFSYTHSVFQYSDDFGTTWDTIETDVTLLQMVPKGDFLFCIKGNQVIRYNVSTSPVTVTNLFTLNCSNNRLRMSGQVLWLSTDCGLYKSSDWGATWQTVQSTWAQWEYGGFCVSGDTIVWHTWDGLKRSVNAGASWQNLNNVPFYTLNMFWRDGELFCIDEALYHSEDGGLSWNTIWVPADITRKMGGMYKHGNLAVGYSDEGIWRSFTGGTTWYLSNGTFKTTALYGFGTAGPFLWDDDEIVMNFSGDEGVSWFAPVVAGKMLHVKFPVYMDGRLYGITYDQKLYRSTGSIKLWEQISASGLPGNILQLVNVGNTMFVANLDPTTDTLQLHRSSDSGATWEKIQSWPNSPTFGNQFANMAVAGGVLYFFHRGVGIIKSSDLGQTWSSANGNYSNTIIGGHDKLVATPDFLYLQNQAEVLASRDSGASWTPMSLELNGSYLADIAARDSILFAYYGEGGMKFSEGLSGIWKPLGYAHFGFPVDNQLVFLSSDNLVVWLRFSNKVKKYPLESIDLTTATARVFYDTDGDGIEDPDEQGIAGALLWLSKSGNFAETDLAGNFTVAVAPDGDTLRVVSSYPYSNLIPPFHLVSNNDNTGKHFAISRQPNITDVSVSLTNTAPFRPGFDNQLVISIQNIGTLDVDAILQLELPSEAQFLDATPAPANIQAGIITWSFDDLSVFENQIIIVRVKTSLLGILGNSLKSTASVSTAVTDNDLSNNQAVLNSIIVGSFDPNDKSVQPAPYTTQHLATEIPLIYTIRFQNTGNYPAERVRIVDTLSHLLEPATVQVLNNSHPVVRSIEGQRTLTFLFDNINLSDSVSNEPGSHGFVQFSIQPVKQIMLNDDIANTAHIFFDFNAPVITNTVHSVVSMPVRVTSADPAIILNTFPNPVANKLWVQIPEGFSGECNFDFISLSGQILNSCSQYCIAGKLVPIDTGNLTSGTYQVVLRKAGKSATGKIIKL